MSLYFNNKSPPAALKTGKHACSVCGVTGTQTLSLPSNDNRSTWTRLIIQMSAFNFPVFKLTMLNKGKHGNSLGGRKLNAGMPPLLRFYGGKGKGESCSSRFAKLHDHFHGAAASAASSTDPASCSHEPSVHSFVMLDDHFSRRSGGGRIIYRPCILQSRTLRSCDEGVDGC